MRPGLHAWRKLASQNEKYAYRYQNMTSHHGLTKRVAAPIATAEFEIRYGLFKLTKRSDKLFKGEVSCQPAGRRLFGLLPAGCH